MASLVNYVQNITSQITTWNESRYLALNVKLKTLPKQGEGRVENNGLVEWRPANKALSLVTKYKNTQWHCTKYSRLFLKDLSVW